MKFFLFGQIGSGKSFVGQLIQRDFGIPYHDADRDLPHSIVAAIKNRQPITEAMRDEFTGLMIARIHSLAAQHRHFCVAQALFKNRHRVRVLEAISDLAMVWIRSPESLTRLRLEQRTSHLASSYYAERINPEFEPPTIPHLVIENSGDCAALRSQLAKLTSTRQSRPQVAG